MNQSTAYITLYSSIFLLGLNGLFSNGMPLDAVTITQARSIFAGIALLLFMFATKGTATLANKKSAAIVYGIGILMGLHWISFFYAMQSSSVAIGMLSLYTFPIMTILLEPLFTRKKLKVVDIGLGAVVLLGLFIIISDHLSDTVNFFSNHVLLGVIAGVASAVLFTLRNILQKYYCAEIPSDTLMLHQMLCIAMMLLYFVDTASLLLLESQQWLYLIILGVLATAIAHTMLIKSYKTFPAKTVAMVSCLQPVLGSFFAWLVLNENLSATTIIGGSIILSVAIYESTKVSV
ncbi:MAG: drug/metabolite transporter (DMT)-like permease [Candidatus Endobugula sp.]|jgi:drug/metabolite transporter (DMT)-like permease